MPLLDTLLTLDRQLAAGNGDTYRRLLRDDAVVIVPGERLDAAGTARAMDSSAGWDEFAFHEPRVFELGDEEAMLTYRFRGRRNDDYVYDALMSSLWTREPDSDWRLAFHQQTPVTHG